MKRVYISCPITLGDGSYNFFQACRAQEILMRSGYACLNPALSMMHPNAKNILHGMWLASDLPFVEICDLIVRLPGESIGADMECDHARKHGIPIWLTSIPALEAQLVARRNGVDPSQRGTAV